MRMNWILNQMLVTLGSSALCAGAWAAEEPVSHGGGHEAAAANPMALELIPYFAAILVFGLAFFILSKTAWPKIAKGLNDRDAKIRGDIEAAERSRKQAERSLQQYEKALSEARQEASRLLESAKAEQVKIAAELRLKTEAEIAAMRDAATREIASAKRSAIAEVYQHMAETATAIASRILQRELNSDDQRTLVEESLGQLQEVRAN